MKQKIIKEIITDIKYLLIISGAILFFSLPSTIEFMLDGLR